MILSSTNFSLVLVIMLILLTTGCTNNPENSQTDPRITIHSSFTSAMPPQDQDTGLDNSTPWIRIEPLGDHQVGDVFTVYITTNLPVGTDLYFDRSLITGSNVTDIDRWGEVRPRYKVETDVSGNNSYSFDMDTKNLKAGQYFFNVTANEWKTSTNERELFPQVSAGQRFFLSDRSDSKDNSPVRTGQLIWKYKTGNSIKSSPTISNGIVYFGSLDRNLYALDAMTGRLKWKCPIIGASSPKVANGVVFVGSFNDIVALNADTGSLKWKYTTGNIVAGSPTIAEEAVYFGSFDKNIYALDAKSGVKKWNFTTGDYVYATPVLANGIIFVSDESMHLFALNATTGARVWNNTIGGGFSRSSPVIANGIIFAGDFTQRLYAVDPSSGTVLWYSSHKDSIGTTPAIGNGLVYAGDYAGKIFATDAKDGKLVWTFHTNGSVLSSPAFADGILYIGSGDRKVYALNASTGKPVWTYTTSDSIQSSPVVYQSVVYVGGDDGFMYALEK